MPGQRELGDLPDELLALRAEEHPLGLVEQQLEVSDLARTRRKLFMLRPDQDRIAALQAWTKCHNQASLNRKNPH